MLVRVERRRIFQTFFVYDKRPRRLGNLAHSLTFALALRACRRQSGLRGEQLLPRLPPNLF